MTSGKTSPAGKGSGKRSAGTGAMPTLPPRAPLSSYKELAGTMISTPAKAGLAASTDGAKATRVSATVLTVRSTSGWM